MSKTGHELLVVGILIGLGMAYHWANKALPSLSQPVGAAMGLATTTILPKPAPGACVAPPVVADNKDLAAQLVGEIQTAIGTGEALAQDRAHNELLPALVKTDPMAAARLIESWPAGPMRNEWLVYLAKLWSAADISGALDWLSRLGDEATRRFVARAAADQIASDDPKGAIELLLLLQAADDEPLLEHHARQWAEARPEEAVDWISTRPNEAQRKRLLPAITIGLAKRDPGAAFVLLNENRPPEAGREKMQIEILKLIIEPDGADH